MIIHRCHSMRNAGFSLIELVLVMSIIAVLALLMIPLIGFFREQARWAVTTARMQDLLTAAAALEKTALTLQRQGGLGGVTLFIRKSQAQIDLVNSNPSRNNPFLDTPMAAKPAEWLTQSQYDQPWYFGFPWNETDRIQARSSSMLPAGTVSESQAIDAAGFQTATLSDLSPLRSFELMSAMGAFNDVADAAASYRTDRGADRRWNDAWGRPLVVAFGLFQPPPRTAIIYDAYSPIATFAQDGWRVAESLKMYGYDRAIYVSVGAVGPSLPAGLPPDSITDPAAGVWTATVLPSLWSRITTACGGSTWTGASFASPPWKSVRTAKDTEGACALSAPAVLR
ncbi:MAG: type II secretion system protein [Planctomycetes bacterium]|nr:type II secretion system protein [Planctomycetota bacterium]